MKFWHIFNYPSFSSFGIPLYDWRGIKMSFTVNSLEPEPEKIFKRREDKDPYLRILYESFPMKEYHPSMVIIVKRIIYFFWQTSFEIQEEFKAEIMEAIQYCEDLKTYLDYIDELIGLLIDIKRKDLAELCLIWAKVPAVDAEMIQVRKSILLTLATCVQENRLTVRFLGH